ncbi:MAG TPA: hypothetical protein VEL74_10885 [Thermoanaerobaculia bacterium]|nr:hypothetical protein [bacterium]HYG63077.1 hypothetical protein [Thermoanaerobaculia bacterium]
MSWRARVRLMVLCVVLGVVSAAQTMALTAMKQTWCDQSGCGCAQTSNGQNLLTFACGCDSTGSWRTCTYG